MVALVRECRRSFVFWEGVLVVALVRERRRAREEDWCKGGAATLRSNFDCDIAVRLQMGETTASHVEIVAVAAVIFATAYQQSPQSAARTTLLHS